LVKDKIFPLTLFIHPACFFQDAQVLGDGGLGDPQSGLKFADTAGPIHQEPNNAEAIAVRQGLQRLQQNFHLLSPQNTILLYRNLAYQIKVQFDIFFEEDKLWAKIVVSPRSPP
jgi:hypothetical protein